MEYAEYKNNLLSEEFYCYINKIIYNAVLHGADCGGSYNSNEYELAEIMDDFLEWLCEDRYKVEIVLSVGEWGLRIPQFVKTVRKTEGDE